MKFDKDHGGCYAPYGNNDDENYTKNLSIIKFKPKSQFKGKLREKLLQIPISFNWVQYGRSYDVVDITELNPGVMKLNHLMDTVPLHLDVDVLNGSIMLKHLQITYTVY